MPLAFYFSDEKIPEGDRRTTVTHVMNNRLLPNPMSTMTLESSNSRVKNWSKPGAI